MNKNEKSAVTAEEIVTLSNDATVRRIIIGGLVSARFQHNDLVVWCNQNSYQRLQKNAPPRLGRDASLDLCV
jgi:hypothetical protein